MLVDALLVDALLVDALLFLFASAARSEGGELVSDSQSH